MKPPDDPNSIPEPRAVDDEGRLYAWRNAGEPIARSAVFDVMAARLDAAKRAHSDELTRQMFADVYGLPHYTPAPIPAWRRAARRARYYVVGVWGAVRDLGNALRGRPHECDSEFYY